MIKANELRIGNLIQRIEYGKAIQYNVDPLLIEAIRKWPGSHGFCPIPLTPDWLERLGYAKKKPQPGIIQWNHEKFDTIEFDNNGIPAINLSEGYWKEIQSVHQLQNLFFALTGEELTVKEVAHG